MVETETETRVLWVSMSRPRPRLNCWKSQCRDRDRDWIYKSLNVETETETEFTKVSMSRPRLENFLFLLWNSKNIWVSMLRPRPRLENFFFCYEILFMLRPRLIKTGKFARCRDRDQSRLDKRCRYRDSIETLVDLWSMCGCCTFD